VSAQPARPQPARSGRPASRATIRKPRKQRALPRRSGPCRAARTLAQLGATSQFIDIATARVSVAFWLPGEYSEFVAMAGPVNRSGRLRFATRLRSAGVRV